MSWGGAKAYLEPTVTEISTGTGPIDIIYCIASKGDSLHGATCAPLPKNTAPQPLGAMRAEHLWSTHSSRDRARPLHARTPDPLANHTHASRCTRRYAPCSWTPRCARALSCDKRSTGSASSVRHPTSGPLCGRLERAEASSHRLRRAPRTRQRTLLRGTARRQLGGLGAASEAEEVQIQTVDTLIGTRPESKGSYKMSM